MTDKELFSIMVHYHPAIVGRLIHNGLCVKKESNIEVLNNSGSSSKKKEFVFPYKILTTDTNGVSKVIASSSEMRRNETLLEVSTNHPEIFNDIDLIKVCEDEVLLDVLIGSTSDHKPNTDVVDYLIETFFLDYNISDYISIVNKLSDWNIISN